MKRILFLLLLLSGICNAQNYKNKIVGEWIATDYDGNASRMIFSEDNYLSMTVNGTFVDGKNLEITEGPNKGIKNILKYELDESTSPIKIDLIATTIDNDVSIEQGRILGIVEFLNNGEIRINLNLNGNRENEFNNENIENTIYLKSKL